jgi:cytosine/creatinine deaminase
LAETTAGTEVVLANATLADGARAHVTIRGERVVRVDTGGPEPAARALDVGGRLLIPGLIDGHLHLDKTLLGLPWVPHAARDSVRERIAAEKHLRARLAEPVDGRAERLLALALGNGTTALRTHVDIDDVCRTTNLERILALREAWAPAVTIQVVAFPQSGILACPGAGELLEEALRLGADLVGGLDPLGIDGDVNGHLDVVFGLAARYGRGIDIHLHDAGEPGLHELVAIAERTRAAGLSGRVAVSHAFCLGSVPLETAARAAESLAACGVAIVTSAPGSAPMPPVRLLRSAGVTLCAGSDNVRDAWSPLGNASMLERCMLVAYRSGFRTDEDLTACLDLATSSAVSALGLSDHGLRPGAYADLLVLNASSVPQAIAERPSPEIVMRRGRVVRGETGGVVERLTTAR